MSDWQPIETAPKDGTYMLLMSRSGVVIGLWDAHEDREFGTVPAWRDDGEGYELHPTHWMPLPDPPKESK
jgi:hypothetical protein